MISPRDTMMETAFKVFCNSVSGAMGGRYTALEVFKKYGFTGDFASWDNHMSEQDMIECLEACESAGDFE